MGKEDAPQGPDFEKLIAKASEFVTANKDLFKEAFTSAKGSFTKGQEFVDRLQNFGMTAMGTLNKAADDFQKTTDARVAGLDRAGQEWGKKADNIYADSKALATDLTGKLMPGMGEAAELGGQMLDSYQNQGIPFQDEYMAKLGGWDTSARREDRAAQAVNDIAMTTEAARESELRRLESYGIDPSQTRSAALDSRLQTANAIAKAVGANTARQAVETEGIGYGKTVSDMYEARREGGLEGIEQAARTGRGIAEIARQPGVDYMDTLTKLGQYGIGVGQLEQQGGAATYDMRSDATRFGERGTAAGAVQQNAVNQFGLDMYDQQASGIATNAEMTQGAYGTAGNLHANDLAATEMNNQNSWGAQLGTIAGVAAPFVLGPAGAALGTAIGGAAGAAITGGANSAMTAAGMAPLAGTTMLHNAQGRSKGGPVKREESPSKGAIPDDVPAFIDAGEYVVDRDTVRWFGEKHFADLQKKAKQGRGIPEQAGA